MKRTLGCLALAAAVAMCGPAAAAEWNPYAPPTSEFETRLQAAAFGEPGGDRALQDWLTGHPDLAAPQRVQGYGQLCRDYGFLTWNRLRATACAELARLKTAQAGGDDAAMARAFADAPPVRAIGAAKVPLAWNIFGTQSAEVTANGVTSSWFVDTGAEVTVLTQSLARRMGVRPVGAAIRVGTTTSDVTGKVGLIDRLQIGAASVENVPILILPDAQLKLGKVHQIEGILGLQVLIAFRRVAWVDGGRMLALGDLAPKARPTAPRIFWQAEGMGVPVRTPLGVMGAFLDTGANATSWRPAGLPLIDPKTLAEARPETARLGGAGGVIEVKQRVLRAFAFDLGPRPVRVARAPLPATDKTGAAQVGMDAVSQFGVFILDFEQMRLDGRLKTAAERKATHKLSLTEKDVELDDRDTKTAAPK